MSIDKKAFGLSDSLISAVSEALKGGQVKIDKNHNGKIDGQDFKMLRKEENIDEKSVSKAQQHAAGAALATQRGEYDGGKKGGAINRMASMKTSELRKFAGTKTKSLPTHKEEVEQVDELSKATLGSYIKKAATDVATNSAATGRHAERSNKIADHQKKTGDYTHDNQRRKDSKTADKAFDKSWKRRQGINKATDKLTKEDVQVDEVLDTNIKKFAYLMKAKKSIKNSDPNDVKQANDIANRTIGAKRLMNKLTKKKVSEDIEQVDELSKATLGSYVNKSAASLGKAGYNAGSTDGTAAKLDPHIHTINKRSTGIKRAVGKLAKEDTQIDELSTDTYHSAAKKAAKRAMGDAQGRSGPIFKKYAGMANKFRDKGMSQEKKEKSVKEAYDDNSSNVSDWSDKKLKWHKEKLSSSSAKAHSELVRRSKTGQAAPKKTNEETLDEIQGTYGNGGNKKNLKIIHKGEVVKDYGTDTKPNKASRDKKAEKMKAYRADRDKNMEEANTMTKVKTTKDIGYKVVDVGPGQKEKIVKAHNWTEPKKKLPNGADYAAQRRKERLAANGRMDEAAENPMAKQLADKKAAIQKTIAQKKMQVMQAKAQKTISSMKEGKGCSCMEGKKSMTCEVHGDKAKGMKGGKEPILMNPPLRD
jgi:hypothetical protein